MNKENLIRKNYASKIADSGEGAVTAVFPQVKKVFFDKYVKELEKNGYEKYSEAYFDGEDDSRKNIFATYHNDTETVTVSHHAFADRMYVTYAPKKDGWELPPVQKPEYTALGDKYPTILTQVGLERFHPTCVSMCYVLRAADGTFVIIDSDMGGTEDVIYDVLKKQAPDPDNIVISAWFFTHPHSDHVGGFIKFAEKYADDKTITLKQVVLNFSQPDLIYDNEQNLQRNTILGAKSFGDDVTFVRAQAGDILYYADLTFRVLYTQEEYTAVSDTPDSNCCSIVTQMETDSGVKVLFGADHAVRGNYNGLLFCEGAIYKWYGDFIKSDVVTCFHHGFGGGADDNVYEVIKPTVVFWPVTYFRLFHDSDGTPYGPVTKSSVNQYFYDPEQAETNGVRACYISGDKIQIMDLSNKDLNVTEYEHCDDYLK